MGKNVRIIALVLACAAIPTGKACDFPKVDARAMTPEEFNEKFVLPARPVVLLNAMDGWEQTRGEWSWENLPNAFKGVPLRVGQGPYPKRSMKIEEYLEEATRLYNEGNTEIPGVFQYGQVPTSWSLWAHKDVCVPVVAKFDDYSEPIHDNLTIACNLLKKVRVPHFVVGSDHIKSPPNIVTHSGFLIGFKNSGIDYHKHQSAINLILHGAKEWHMKVPKRVVESYEEFPRSVQLPQEEMYCNVNPRDSVCEMQKKQDELVAKLPKNEDGGATLPDIKAENYNGDDYFLYQFAKNIHTTQRTEELEEDVQVLHCVQKAGEIVYIPGGMQHAVKNMEHTIGMQMQWENTNYKNRQERYLLYKYLLSELDPTEPDPDMVHIEVPPSVMDANIASMS